MRTWSSLAAAACLTLTSVVACGDASKSPLAPGAPSATTAPLSPASPTTTLDAEIRTILNTRYPSLERAAITWTWNAIVNELAESTMPGISPEAAKREIAEARFVFVGLATFIKARTPRVIPPSGETKEHVVARLMLLMSLYVYAGPGTPPPVLVPSGDAVFAIVQPSATATTTVRTPTQHAAVQFPPGSLAETRIVVITQEPVLYPVNCSGPLNTRLCQYPQFYKFDVFPDNRLQIPAIAAVCHINSGSSRAPLASHDRFRVAHDAPANTADRVEGGTIVDGIEILPYAEVFGLTSCEGNSYQIGAAPNAPRGALGRALHWVADPAQRVASAILGQLAPRTAYAIDGIGGGNLRVFSTFAVVDPASSPDLAVTSEVPGFEGSFLRGTTVPLGSWAVTNRGTATAQNVIVSVIVATDVNLTSGVVRRVDLTSAASLAPRANLGGSEASITLPDDMAPGSYFVGFRVVSNNELGIQEQDYSNNAAATPVEVRRPPEPIGILSQPSFELACLNCYPINETGLSSVLTYTVQYSGVTQPEGYFRIVTESGNFVNADSIFTTPGLTGTLTFQSGLWFGGAGSSVTQQTKRITYVWPRGSSNEVLLVVPRGDMQ